MKKVVHLAENVTLSGDGELHIGGNARVFIGDPEANGMADGDSASELPAMTMREKMARAMYDLMRSRIPDGVGPLHAWDEQNDKLHDDWLATVDAALDALMEPTADMEAEGYSAAYAADNGTDEVAEVVVRHSWSAMIRAAKEGK